MGSMFMMSGPIFHPSSFLPHKPPLPLAHSTVTQVILSCWCIFPSFMPISCFEPPSAGTEPGASWQSRCGKQRLPGGSERSECDQRTLWQSGGKDPKHWGQTDTAGVQQRCLQVLPRPEYSHHSLHGRLWHFWASCSHRKPSIRAREELTWAKGKGE